MDAERVAALIRKEDLKNDTETQVLEDVACLVFLDDQFEKFEREYGDEEKVVGILRKTWAKMTDEGHRLARGIPMEGRPRRCWRGLWLGDETGCQRNLNEFRELIQMFWCLAT